MIVPGAPVFSWCNAVLDWEMPSFVRDNRPDHLTPKPLKSFGIPIFQHVARGGVGGGVVDRLRQLGFSSVVG